MITAVLPRSTHKISALADLADSLTGVGLAQVATGVLAWIIVPGIVGVARELRTEVR